MVARGVNWIEPPGDDAIEAQVQIRYRAPAIDCAIRRLSDDRCEVIFKDAFPAVTPGQAAVFYRGNRVLGGGWIEKQLKMEN